jgi:hypothetical protein
MKRIYLLALGLLSLGALLYAQSGDSPQQDNRPPRRGAWFFDGGVSAEKLSLSGTLGLSRGIIVLQSGEETWYTPELQRYTGFIDALKEGAAVTLEGWGRKIPQVDGNVGFLRVSKLTLNGKDYEIGPAEPWAAQGPGWDRPRVPEHREYLPGPPGWDRRNRMRPGRGMEHRWYPLCAGPRES